MLKNVNVDVRAVSMPNRAHPVTFGTVLFLASELMFFAALFATYYDLRAIDMRWPQPGVHLDPVEATIGTAFLFVASLVMVKSMQALQRSRFAAARWWTAAAIAAALAFIVLSLRGYADSGIALWTSAYGSIYYTLTGFHLLHVLVGIGILTAFLIGARSQALLAYQRQGAEAMTYYWHFVFVVWLGIWVTVYFIR